MLNYTDYAILEPLSAESGGGLPRYRSKLLYFLSYHIHDLVFGQALS